MSMQFGHAVISQVKKANAALFDKDLPRPERQRGMWSFLTWSFFLANFLTATEIIGGSAHAATADSDHGDASQSDGGNSYSGGSQPEMQHLTLESLPSAQESHAANPRVALNPIADGQNAGADLVPVHNIPVAQPHMESTGGSYGSYSGSSASYNAINNYYSIDSHDTTSTTVNNYVNVDSHDVTNVIHTVVNPVVEVVEHVTEIVTPVINIVDTTVQGATGVVTQVVDTVGEITGNLTSTLGTTVGTVVDTVGGVVGSVDHLAQDLTGTVATTLDTTLGAVTGLVDNGVGSVTSLVDDVANTATHTVGALVGDVAPLASDLTSTVTTVADATIHTIGDAVGDVIGNAAQTVTGLTDSVIHSVTASVSFDTLASPVTSLLDHDGSPVTSVADSTSGLHDLLGSTLHSLGVSSSGSLSFAAETPDAIVSNDVAANTPGYSQFNLAVSDASHDAGVSAPASTDTGGITTIVASAIGLGPHTTDSASDSGDHGSDQTLSHLPLLDDLHSHLHLGLFG